VRATEQLSSDLFSANSHVYIGFAVLALAIWRLAIRLKRGVPGTPARENPTQIGVAAATHGLLYLFILGMPVTGALAWYLDLSFMGEVHELAKPVIIAAVAPHSFGALWQHCYAKSDVLIRIMKPAAR
jgi:cytochrome b561